MSDQDQQFLHPRQITIVDENRLRFRLGRLRFRAVYVPAHSEMLNGEFCLLLQQEHEKLVARADGHGMALSTEFEKFCALPIPAGIANMKKALQVSWSRAYGEEAAALRRFWQQFCLVRDYVYVRYVERRFSAMNEANLLIRLQNGKEVVIGNLPAVLLERLDAARSLPQYGVSIPVPEYVCPQSSGHQRLAARTGYQTTARLLGFNLENWFSTLP